MTTRIIDRLESAVRTVVTMPIGALWMFRHRDVYREWMRRSRLCARCHHAGGVCEFHSWYLEWLSKTGEHPPAVQEQRRHDRYRDSDQ